MWYNKYRKKGGKQIGKVSTDTRNDTYSTNNHRKSPSHPRKSEKAQNQTKTPSQT